MSERFSRRAFFETTAVALAAGTVASLIETKKVAAANCEPAKITIENDDDINWADPCEVKKVLAEDEAAFVINANIYNDSDGIKGFGPKDQLVRPFIEAEFVITNRSTGEQTHVKVDANGQMYEEIKCEDGTIKTNRVLRFKGHSGQFQTVAEHRVNEVVVSETKKEWVFIDIQRKNYFNKETGQVDALGKKLEFKSLADCTPQTSHYGVRPDELTPVTPEKPVEAPKPEKPAPKPPIKVPAQIPTRLPVTGDGSTEIPK